MIEAIELHQNSPIHEGMVLGEFNLPEHVFNFTIAPLTYLTHRMEVEP